MKHLLIVIVSSLLYISTIQCDVVPAFLWTTSRIQGGFPAILAGHTVTDQEFQDDFLQKIFPLAAAQQTASKDSDSISLAVFLEEEMSLQDLTRKAQVFNSSVKGAVYAHLRNIMSTTSSQFLPSVYSVFDTVMSVLRGESDTDQTISQKLPIVEIWNPDVESFGLRYNEENSVENPARIYIIHLPASASPKEIDEIIWKTDRELTSTGRPYSAIYTGKNSLKNSQPEVLLVDNSQEEIQLSSSRASSRKLQQQNYYPNEYMFVNVTNCLYLYAQNVTLSILDGGVWSLPLDVTPDDTSFCANYSAELSLTYYNLDENLREVNLFMIFGVTEGMEVGYWYMPNFTITYSLFNGTWDNVTTKMYPYFVTETPYGFSYSCYQLPPISPLHTMDGLGLKTVNITFAGFQLQAFNITNYQFGYYNDCVPFFTITTWAVLFTLFIMVGILLFAACMFAGLSTHDRYEDAHGKQLVINTLD